MPGRNKSELRQRRLFVCFENKCGLPRMQCVAYVTSHVLNNRVCEYVTSGKLYRLSGSSSSCIGPSAWYVTSSIGDSAFNENVVSGKNCFGENKMTMFKTYCGNLRINPRGMSWLREPSVAVTEL